MKRPRISQREWDNLDRAKSMVNRFTFDMGKIRGKRARRLKKWLAVFNKLTRGLVK